MPTSTVFDPVRKTAVISRVSLNLNQKKWYQDVQLLQNHIKFYPDHLKRVGEKEAKRFYMGDTLIFWKNWKRPGSRGRLGPGGVQGSKSSMRKRISAEEEHFRFLVSALWLPVVVWYSEFHVILPI